MFVMVIIAEDEICSCQKWRYSPNWIVCTLFKLYDVTYASLLCVNSLAEVLLLEHEIVVFRAGTGSICFALTCPVPMASNDEVARGLFFFVGIECKFYISGLLEEVSTFLPDVTSLDKVRIHLSWSIRPQNELVLVGVLDSIFDTISTLLKGQVDKRTMFDNLELILLTIDEALDHGHIMELDPLAIVSRVLMKASEATAVSIETLESR